jgi:hypothetical protein
MALQSRVFISCGQGSEEEKNIAREIKERLERELNFNAYVATMDHSLNSLTQNIFDELEHSEYFLFLDFKREQLCSSKQKKAYRGSLFTNQELAIAAFIKDIRILGFQEEGVNKIDGMLKYLQINCDSFSDRASLPELIVQRIREEGWVTGWRNELQLNFNPEGIQAKQVSGDVHTFYHFEVKNLNKRKMALNCCAFIEKIESVGISPYRPALSELKWKNQKQAQLSIPPGETRLLDAYRIPSDRSYVMLALNIHQVDSDIPEDYKLRDGEHVITYVVYSENFTPTRIKLKITKHGYTIIPLIV